MLDTRFIKTGIDVDAGINDVFRHLISPSLIKRWWSAKSVIVVPEEGGFITVLWGENEDDPDYVTLSRILEIDAPVKLVVNYEMYYTKFGKLPFGAEMEVHYTLTDLENGTRLDLLQTGFPEDESADAFYYGCINGWKNTLEAFKQVCESSQ